MKLLRLAIIVSLMVPTLALAQRGGSRGGGGGSRGGGGGGGISRGSVGGGGGFRGGGGTVARGGSSFVGGGFRGGSTGFRGGNTVFRGGNRVIINGGFGFRSFYPGLYLGFGYGYGYPYYYGGYPYYDPYYSDPYYYGASYGTPGYSTAYPEAAPVQPTVINQNIGAGTTSSGVATTGSFYRPADYYLIAFNDHTIRAALSYRVEGDQILYTTREHEEKSAPLDTVDRRFSEQVNRDRRVEFRLP
jgi:hypothetical protein